MTHNFPLPDNFIETLHELTYLIMLKKPKNYMQFGAKYFGRLNNKESLEGIVTSYESTSMSHRVSTASSTDSLNSEEIETRRQGVAGEHFDPDEVETSGFEVHEKTETQRMQLLTACEGIALFNSLTQSDLLEVIDSMFQVNVTTGQNVITEGEDGEHFYVIESGTFDAIITKNNNDTVIKTYEDEGSFGELALIMNAPRAATVRAKSDGSLWALPRNVFRGLVLTKTYKKREQYKAIISNVPMLQTLNEQERANLCDALVAKDCKAGEIILNEGDPGSQMYFIINGKIEIFKSVGDEKRVITTLDAGKYFGELSLLSNQPRAASAMALTYTQLAILDVKGFERLMGPCIEIMKRNTVSYKTQVAEAFGQ